MTRHEFHPPHVYLDNACYFITASTNCRARFLDTDAKRSLVRDVLKKTAQRHGVRL